MAIATKLMTAEEFMLLPDDGVRHELVRGEVFSRSHRTWECGEIAGNIGATIKTYLLPNRIGQVALGVGAIVARNPDTVRAPDVSFLGMARIPHGERMNRYVDGVPDLCVEIPSDTNSRSDIREKLGEYFAGGAKLVWVVDPDDRSVKVYRDAANARVVKEDAALDGGDVLPGFSCPVSKFFN